MASTGEVGCLGDDFEEAFLKALISVGFRLPIRRALLSTGPIETKAAFLEGARTLRDMDVTLYATGGTAAFLRANGIEAVLLHWPTESASPNTLEYLSQRKIDLMLLRPGRISHLDDGPVARLAAFSHREGVRRQLVWRRRLLVHREPGALVLRSAPR